MDPPVKRQPDDFGKGQGGVCVDPAAAAPLDGEGDPGGGCGPGHDGEDDHAGEDVAGSDEEAPTEQVKQGVDHSLVQTQWE